MANEEQVALLRQGSEVWNQWRREKPDVAIDCCDANLSCANLSGADLSGVNLSNAILGSPNFKLN